MIERLDDPEVERLARERRVARGLRRAARRAADLARKYRAEEGGGGERERACVRQALAWRTAARHLLAGRPGLARAVPPDAAAQSKVG
jgi:hypothetical protein